MRKTIEGSLSDYRSLLWRIDSFHEALRHARPRAHLRYEIVPHLDQQLESGARPADIQRSLAIQGEMEQRRARESEIASILVERAPDANQEYPLTRIEEDIAFYTLRALGEFDSTTNFALDDEFTRRSFLLLDLAPVHYTEEVRAILLDHSSTAREKAEHIKRLESGAIAPSTNLRLLLTEFEQRTHEQSTRDQQMIAADFKFTLDNEIIGQKVSRAVEQITRQSMIQDSNQVDLNYHHQNSTV